MISSVTPALEDPPAPGLGILAGEPLGLTVSDPIALVRPRVKAKLCKRLAKTK